MKTIAYVSLNRFKPSLKDGGSRTMWELLRAMGRRGYRIVVFNALTEDSVPKSAFEHFRQPGDPTYQKLTARSYSIRIQETLLCQHLLPYAQKDLPAHYEEVISTLHGAIREHGADFVLSSEGDYASGLASYLSSIPGAMFFHSQASIREVENNALLRKVLKRTTVYCASSFLQSEASRLLGIESEVWNPYIEFERYRFVTAPKGSAIGYYSSGFLKGDPVIERIVALNPARRFLIAGRRPSFVQRPAMENTEYLGIMNNMASFYSRISLLLVPSILPEAFSRVIIEAASNGIPTIANAVGGVPEALGEGGLTIEVDIDSPIDADAIARAYSSEIGRLLDDTGLLDRFRERSLERASAYQSSQEAMLDNFLENVVGP